MLWNALALETAVAAARREGQANNEADLQRVLPSMVEHIDFVGRKEQVCPVPGGAFIDQFNALAA